MYSVQSRQFQFLQKAGGGDIGAQHTFLNQPVRVITLHRHDALNFFVGAIILNRVSTAPEIDLDILSGALGLYLLIAITWAVSFAVIENLAPGSFSAGETPIPWARFLYFSLTTMTTLGYGDLVPTGGFARIWATMEAVTGTLYIAVLVARLVSHYKDKP